MRLSRVCSDENRYGNHFQANDDVKTVTLKVTRETLPSKMLVQSAEHRIFHSEEESHLNLIQIREKNRRILAEKTASVKHR